MRPRKLNVARGLSALALLALVAGRPAVAAEKPQITVQEHTLSNGMRWLLYEQHDSPTIAAGWTARVGSVNERPGITGLSHFFEHMMFKGTKTIGTKDIDEDLRLIEEQEKIRDAMRAEMEVMREKLRRGEIDDLQKPESWTERYRELDKQFDALVQKQRETIVKDQMDQIYTKNGGEFLNAFTSEDQTAYFVRIPRNRLELWAWLESDRLMDPVFREFYSERDVVFEERRLRTESTPLGKYDEAFERAVLGSEPVQLAGGGLGLGHPDVHARPGQAVLRHLLRPQQPHRRPGRRLQGGGGPAAPRALLRPHPARARSSPRPW